MSTRALRSDAFASVGRILDAARRLLTSGDGSITLARIANEAGVGVATLYRHFSSRQALAAAVYERIFTTEIEPALTALDPGTVDRGTILDVAERLTDVLRRERGVVAALDDVVERTAALLAREQSTFTDVVTRAQQAGQLRPDLTADDLPYLVAMVATGLGAVETVDAGVRRRYLSLLLDGLNPARAVPLPPA